MSASGPKRSEVKEKAAIPSGECTPLRPVTEQKIVKLRETLKRDKLKPWLCLSSRGVRITDFYGKTITYPGVAFEGSPRLVFWSFIKPFLQEAIVKTLDETLEIAHARGYDPEACVREAGMLLKGNLIWSVYVRMRTMDRKLTAGRNWKSARPKDITHDANEMVSFLNKGTDQIIQGLEAERGAPIMSRRRRSALCGVLLVVLGGPAVLLAWQLGEGANLWQKIMSSSLSLGVVLALVRHLWKILSKPRPRVPKSLNGGDK